MRFVGNPIGDDGLTTLVAAVEASSVGSICGIVEGQTSVDWSNQNFSPFDCKIIAADFGFRRFIAVVKKIALSNNFLFGSKRFNKRTIHNVDADQSGWSALCDALPGSPVEELDVSDIGMGGNGVTSLAKATSSMAVLNSLAVGSNPIGDEAMIQLLDGLRDVSLTSLDISKTQSGVSTATKLAELLAEDSKFKAALASVNLSGNRAIDQESRSALQESVSSRQPTIELIWDK